jgi:hypothetical protein
MSSQIVAQKPCSSGRLSVAGQAGRGWSGSRSYPLILCGPYRVYSSITGAKVGTPGDIILSSAPGFGHWGPGQGGEYFQGHKLSGPDVSQVNSLRGCISITRNI